MEKKTFKGTTNIHWEYEPLAHKYGWVVESLPIFFADEWDMEVTFTKKPVQRKVGDVIRVSDFEDDVVYTVLAIHKDQIVVVNQYDDIEIFGAGYFS